MQLLTAFTENEEIYPFVFYVTNQEQQKEKRGRPKGVEEWRVQVDPDQLPWLALKARPTLTEPTLGSESTIPRPRGKNYILIRWL